MNKDRRKQLNDALEAVTAALDAAEEVFENVKGEEEEAKESLPQSLQDGEKGQLMDSAIEALDEAIGSIDTCRSELEDSVARATE